jgi:hypothetical protein
MLSSRISLIILAAAFLSACQPDIQTAPPVPTPDIWQVQYTPATAWLAPYFQTCAYEQQGVALVVSERPAQVLDVLKADFSGEWGERTHPPPFAAVIAQDQVAIVVNPANPISSLPVSEVQRIFSGKDGNWSQWVKSKCPSCGSDFEGPVKAFVYAPNTEIQLAAAWITPGPEAILAPNPAAVVAEIASERFGIGFVPARGLDATVKQVVVEGAKPDLLNLPVLAMAPADPQGARRTWLSCVQAQIH